MSTGGLFTVTFLITAARPSRLSFVHSSFAKLFFKASHARRRISVFHV